MRIHVITLLTLFLVSPEWLAAQFAIPVQTTNFGNQTAGSDNFILTGYTGSSLNPVSGGPDFRIASGFWGSVKKTTHTAIEHDAFIVPDDFYLEANYPNPFNPSTKIKYGIPEAAQVRLSVINSVGQEIAILVDKELAPGTYLASWDAIATGGNALPSGIYFYHLQSPNFSQTRKMVFLK